MEDHHPVPNTVRSLIGRSIAGPVLRLDSASSSNGQRLTVLQASGPMQHFVIHQDSRSAAALMARLLGVLRIAIGAILLFLGVVGIPLGFNWAFTGEWDLEQSIIGEVTYVVMAYAGYRLLFAPSLRRKHQSCPHINQIGAVLTANDPKGTAWAAEAVGALHDGSFCVGSPQLHAMALGTALLPAVPAVPAPAEPTMTELMSKVDAAAARLHAHGRPSDAAAIHELRDSLTEFVVADQTTIGFAADAIAQSFDLLDGLPPALQQQSPGPGQPSPQDDADASVDAALAELTRLVRVHADSDIQALQALRIYTGQWQRPDPLDLE